MVLKGFRRVLAPKAWPPASILGYLGDARATTVGLPPMRPMRSFILLFQACEGAHRRLDHGVCLRSTPFSNWIHLVFRANEVATCWSH